MIFSQEGLDPVFDKACALMHLEPGLDGAIQDAGDVFLAFQALIFGKIPLDKVVCGQTEREQISSGLEVIKAVALSQNHPFVQVAPGGHGDEDEVDDREAKDKGLREFHLEQQGKQPVSSQKGEELFEGKEELRIQVRLDNKIQKGEGDLRDQLPQRGFKACGYTKGENGQPQIQMLAIDQRQAHSCGSCGSSGGSRS